MKEVGIWALSLLLIVLFGLACFKWGASQAKVEIVEKEIEVVKYETKEVYKIMAQPNLGDDDIIRLYDSGKL